MDALAALLGKAGPEKKSESKPDVIVEIEPKKAGPSEDLVKAVADFKSAVTPAAAAEALLLAVQLANEQGNSDLDD